MSQDNVKKLKKGEILFKEGEAAEFIYVIQSGRIGLFLERSGKKLEVMTAGPTQVLGEQCLTSSAKHFFMAEALQETRLLEVPAEALKSQFEKSPAGIKLLVKSLIDEAKSARQTIRSFKMETEKSPCPQGAIPRLFTLLHVVPRHIGRPAPDDAQKTLVSWTPLKLYLSRFFGESPQRLRHLLDLLLKLKMAEFQVKETEDGDDLGDIRFSRLDILENFAEFYQYHLLKGQRAEAIYVDPLALKVAKTFVEISVEAPKDHHGASLIEYDALLAGFKERHKQELKSTHLDSLEKKGLFFKRKSHDDGRITISFDRNEFENTSVYWSIIYEIDKWNEKGFVDLHEKEEAVQGSGEQCPQCQQPLATEHRFCPSCGFKVAA